MALRMKWYADVPVGVRQSEYRSYLGARALSFAGFAFAALVLFSFVMGLGQDRRREEEAKIPMANLAKVAAGELPAYEAIRLTGRLTTEAPVFAPSDPATALIAGRLEVTLRGEATERSGGRGRDIRARPLFRWEEHAPGVFLTDGVHRMELSAALSGLPLMRRSARTQVERKKDEDNQRIPIALEVGALRLDLPPEKWAGLRPRTVRGRAELEVMERDTAVTVVAAPIKREDGTVVLGEPEGAALTVRRGAGEASNRAFPVSAAMLSLMVGALALGITQRRRANARFEDFKARQKTMS